MILSSLPFSNVNIRQTVINSNVKNLTGMWARLERDQIFWEALWDSQDLITRPTKFISLWTCCLIFNKFISYRVLFLFLLINIFSDSCWDQDYLMCFQSTPLKKTWDLISSGLLAPILWSESQQNLKMYTKI